MMSQVFVTGPKLGVHIQLVKVENQRKLSRRLFFLARLDQLADTWTDQVSTPLAHLNKTRWSLLAQLATKQGNFSWCEYVISKKTLKRMKNKEDLASKVSKASARSAAFIHVTGSTHNSYRHQVSHFIHSTSIMSYLILSSTSITHTQRWNQRQCLYFIPSKWLKVHNSYQKIWWTREPDFY